jgi:hypothetical protein
MHTAGPYPVPTPVKFRMRQGQQRPANTELRAEACANILTGMNLRANAIRPHWQVEFQRRIRDCNHELVIQWCAEFQESRIQVRLNRY